ncbi:aldo/keto reductase [Poronia punctata]|nr:aldo/keto reductase [Poronia punctata]
MVQITDKEVGPTGFGLMGFTWRPNPCSKEQAFEAMREAVKQGNVFWVGGDFYGPPDYNSNVLLEQYFEKYPEDADKVVLSLKGGWDPSTFTADASPEGTRKCLDNSIRQLNGRKKIDIFEYARRDPKVDMKTSFETIQKEYIDTGKVGGIGLSEVRAETIHEAVKIAKIVAVEVELSLFNTDVLYNGVAEACAKYDIPIVAYSPIGSGFLTGQIKRYEDIPEGRLQRHMPRYQPGEAFDHNIKLVYKVEEMAKKKSCTPAQLALGWIRALNGRPGMPKIIPIPGATTVERIKENAQLVELTDEDMAAIDEILDNFKPLGNRNFHLIPIET